LKLRYLALALASSSVVPLIAQAPQPPVFRAGTDLVEVDVIARDKNGLFVSDLALDDFELQEDGKPYPVQQAYLRLAGPKGWSDTLRGSPASTSAAVDRGSVPLRRTQSLRRRLRRCAPVRRRIQTHAGPRPKRCFSRRCAMATSAASSPAA
jgi:hypothetical protein